MRALALLVELVSEVCTIASLIYAQVYGAGLRPKCIRLSIGGCFDFHSGPNAIQKELSVA